METRIGKWLIDIYNQIGEIDGYLAQNSSFEDYQENGMLKRATERNLMIIGEAINRIISNQPDIGITNARQIISFRNIIVHNYDTVSDELVWSIIQSDLPDLKTYAPTSHSPSQ